MTAGLQKAIDEVNDFIKKSKEDPTYVLELPPEQSKEPEKEKDVEDSEDKFKQLWFKIRLTGPIEGLTSPKNKARNIRLFFFVFNFLDAGEENEHRDCHCQNLAVKKTESILAKT
ncbi:unnamed protein product [Acanthoscelides obtectus]|uniref:Uncharacterized protein n=1 Tax=Acanthoscelides obtectus TaxID=200917 RepID=A0A9P0LDG0_ACAOB|nr:unnamed protein product [Acanthoscelides obtectus]CAK1624142.1 hypothetical protein AOBTE_LOCUS2347 [Acanthoscelides obtectus]